jgi:uncharacterized protein
MVRDPGDVMSGGETAGALHDAPASRFVVREAGAEAELLYRRKGNRLVLVHTEVPEQLGGRGIGGRLVRAAIEWAVRDALVIVPWCPFARAWLADHPDATGAATIDWAARPRKADRPNPVRSSEDQN